MQVLPGVVGKLQVRSEVICLAPLMHVDDGVASVLDRVHCYFKRATLPVAVLFPGGLWGSPAMPLRIKSRAVLHAKR